MDERPIGVFDSGVGGLSVLIELKKQLSKENFVFLADQKYVPYGEKSKKELLKLVYKITDYFVREYNIKMMVVACNTATSYTIEELRATYSFPIIGTVPAVKLAANNTKSNTIAVISTPSTSQSQKLKNLIVDNCKGLSVLNIGCKNLADMVEEGELDSPKVNRLLSKYLEPVINSPADQLVLGCTHYPFLKKSIRKIIGPKVQIIDSGKAIAKRTQTLLEVNSIKNKQKKKGETLYFTTGNALKFSKVSSELLKTKINAQKVNL